MRYGSLCLAVLALVAAPAVPAVAALAIGDHAPDFTAPASLAGKAFRFSMAEALRRGPVVLYFYPAAFTSGCTVEAHDFAEAVPAFQQLGATVIGVSGDDIATLNRFSVSECRSRFAVAAADGKLISAYRVKLPVLSRSNRTSYVIAPDGRVLLAYSALDPAGHVARAMAAVKAWRAAAAR